MAVSKRLRFEIFRRDNHACRYCGAIAPEAKLTVDHVTPTALGGGDEPSNLVTACSDCNSGKTSITPDSPLVEDVAQEAVLWSAAMRAAAELETAKLKSEKSVFEHFEHHVWGSWTHGYKQEPFPLPVSWRNSIRSFLAAGLTMELLAECVDIACERDSIRPDVRFKYMCGVAWRKLTEMQESARSLLAEAEARRSEGE